MPAIKVYRVYASAACRSVWDLRIHCTDAARDHSDQPLHGAGHYLCTSHLRFETTAFCLGCALQTWNSYYSVWLSSKPVLSYAWIGDDNDSFLQLLLRCIHLFALEVFTE